MNHNRLIFFSNCWYLYVLAFFCRKKLKERLNIPPKMMIGYQVSIARDSFCEADSVCYANKFLWTIIILASQQCTIFCKENFIHQETLKFWPERAIFWFLKQTKRIYKKPFSKGKNVIDTSKMNFEQDSLVWATPMVFLIVINGLVQECSISIATAVLHYGINMRWKYRYSQSIYQVIHIFPVWTLRVDIWYWFLVS